MSALFNFYFGSKLYSQRIIKDQNTIHCARHIAVKRHWIAGTTDVMTPLGWTFFVFSWKLFVQWSFRRHRAYATLWLFYLWLALYKRLTAWRPHQKCEATKTDMLTTFRTYASELERTCEFTASLLCFLCKICQSAVWSQKEGFGKGDIIACARSTIDASVCLPPPLCRYVGCTPVRARIL